MQRIYFFNKEFSSVLEIGLGNSNHMTFVTQIKSKLVTSVIFCTEMDSDRKGPGFQSRYFPNKNYSHGCGCLCKQATFTTFIERDTFSVSSLWIIPRLFIKKKKDKYWPLKIFFKPSILRNAFLCMSYTFNIQGTMQSV